MVLTLVHCQSSNNSHLQSNHILSGLHLFIGKGAFVAFALFDANHGPVEPFLLRLATQFVES